MSGREPALFSPWWAPGGWTCPAHAILRHSAASALGPFARALPGHGAPLTDEAELQLTSMAAFRRSLSLRKPRRMEPSDPRPVVRPLEQLPAGCLIVSAAGEN